ncbi:hypothetical protein [Flavisolibacter nicotianae]|uniref:hypothetical protein n=1 Tax=Flavisolibacter nicotianae TaxID=2364882 RepID=UPI0013C48BA9|nr:hypothetical protein [Flavisolibacter nicotianae]
MKEYKLSKGWAWFIYIMAPLLAAVFIYLLVMPFLPDTKSSGTDQLKWFLVPISLLMIGVCVAGVIDAVKGRFVITQDSVYAKGVFTNRELLLHEIEGYRTDDRYIYIVPFDKSLKQIKVSTYFSGTGDILAWLSERFPDLDEQKAAAEEAEILSDETLGMGVEEREEQLRKARLKAKALNWAGGLVAAWTWFLPQPYEVVIFLCILLPIICLLLVKSSKGLIRMEEKKKSAYPSVFSGVLFPSLALCIRALMDFNLLQYGNVWKGTLMLAGLFMTVLLVRSKEFTFRSAKDYGLAFGITILVLAYSFGAVVTANCTWDNSTTSVYHAQVTGKHISSGKTTTYYVSLTPWGPQTKEDDVSVSKALYNRLQAKDDVSVYFRQGWFGISWFFITP